jgi:hypothetical protein
MSCLLGLALRGMRSDPSRNLTVMSKVFPLRRAENKHNCLGTTLLLIVLKDGFSYLTSNMVQLSASHQLLCVGHYLGFLGRGKSDSYPRLTGKECYLLKYFVKLGDAKSIMLCI